ARTPCSRPTQGGAGAAIGPNRHGPSRESMSHGVASGPSRAVLRAGGTWSRDPLAGCDRGAGHWRVATGLARVSAVRSPKGPLFLATTRLAKVPTLAASRRLEVIRT